MGIDEQLLALNNQAEEKSGELQAAKRQPVSAGDEASNLSLREQVVQSRREEAAQKAEKDQKDVAAATNPARLATDNLLKSAWLNLITSFGLTLLYINAHVLLRKVFGPRFFSDLGEEWVPPQAKKAGGMAVKEASGLLRIAEKAGCVLLNLLVLFLIIAVAALISVIVSIVEEPFKSLFNLISSELSDLVSLIKNLW